jgi:hypothetical protein
MSSEPAKKERPKPKLIEGLTLLDPAKLAGDFRRFRNDDLYFIATCLFHPPGGAKPIPRIIAMTPVAFFVTDPTGKMDRASRYEGVTEAYEQTIMSKSIFGGTTKRNILLRVPKEVDCQISFDLGQPQEQEAASSCLQILKKIVEDKTKKPFNISEIDAGKDISTIRNDTAASGYMSPEDILRQNKERKIIEEKLNQCAAEAVDVKRQIAQIYKDIDAKSKELKQLESVVGVDLSVLRKEKAELQKQQVNIHKKLTLDGIDLVKQQADCTRLREQLDEERQNYDKLVKQRLTSAGTSASQQQNEMMQLRQKAQQREIAKASAKLTAAKEALAAPPMYSGPEALVANARDLETKVMEALEKWERDMESSNKIDKFLDALNAEISRISYHIAEKNQQKQQLLQQRDDQRAKMIATPAAAAKASPATAVQQMPDMLDDDLLGGSGLKRVPSDGAIAQAPQSIRQDDDIFGDSAAPGGDLDDLLDGPAPAAKPAPTEEDLF